MIKKMDVSELARPFISTLGILVESGGSWVAYIKSGGILYNNISLERKKQV